MRFFTGKLVQNDNPPVIFDDTLPCTGRAWLAESVNRVGVRFFSLRLQNDRIKPQRVILSESEVSHKLAGGALLLWAGDSSQALPVQNDKVQSGVSFRVKRGIA